MNGDCSANRPRSGAVEVSPLKRIAVREVEVSRVGIVGGASISVRNMAREMSDDCF